MVELSELDALLEPDRGKGIPKAEIETAIQAILFHQCLYEDTRGIGGTYDLLRRQRRFFERFFSAMGHQLVFEPKEGMVALLPPENAYGFGETRLQKDQTLVLLALRLLLEQAFKAGTMTETGRAEATTDDLYDVLRSLARTEPPSETRLLEILKGFRRSGLVRIGERDASEQIRPIVILPGVRLVCSDAFARALVAWADAEPEPQLGEDVFAYATRIQQQPESPASGEEMPEVSAEANVTADDMDDEV